MYVVSNVVANVATFCHDVATFYWLEIKELLIHEFGAAILWH